VGFANKALVRNIFVGPLYFNAGSCSFIRETATSIRKSFIVGQEFEKLFVEDIAIAKDSGASLAKRIF